MYHRVLDPNNLTGTDAAFLDPGMYVTTQDFEMQMGYICRNYEVIDAHQLVRTMRNGDKLTPYTCLITFDDGWKDNYTHALPILKKYDLPATVFLVSDYIGTNRWFWSNKLSLLLLTYIASGGVEASWATACARITKSGLGSLLSHPHLHAEERIIRFLRSLKSLAPKDIDSLIQELEEVLSAHNVAFDYSERLVLTWEEIIEMSRHRITFGAHTRTHPILTNIPIPDAADEITQSKITIEERLKTECSSFCYPNGDYNRKIKDTVMAHYDCAFSTHEGFVHTYDDPFSLKRVGVHHAASCTRALFACRASGILLSTVGWIKSGSAHRHLASQSRRS